MNIFSFPDTAILTRRPFTHAKHTHLDWGLQKLLYLMNEHFLLKYLCANKYHFFSFQEKILWCLFSKNFPLSLKKNIIIYCSVFYSISYTLCPLHIYIYIYIYIYISINIYIYILAYIYIYTHTHKYTHTHTHIYIYIYNGLMVIVVGNGHGDTSSNLGQDWLHFT